MKPIDIIEIVCTYLGVDENEISRGDRKQGNVVPRFICMHLLYKHTGLPFAFIGKLFNRDHSTVMNANTKVEEWIFTDVKMKKTIIEIETIILESEKRKVETIKKPTYDINHVFKTA